MLTIFWRVRIGAIASASTLETPGMTRSGFCPEDRRRWSSLTARVWSPPVSSTSSSSFRPPMPPLSFTSAIPASRPWVVSETIWAVGPDLPPTNRTRTGSLLEAEAGGGAGVAAGAATAGGQREAADRQGGEGQARAVRATR